MTSESAPAISPAKRSPPPPADLSRPDAGQPPTKRPRENKFDPTTVLPPSTDAAEILKQVEFYFSDANLPLDKYLWTLTQSDPKKEGWVPIQNIASFKRMQRFKPLETIVEALRGSKELLEVSEDGTSVRRKVPLVKPSEEVHKELSNRTVYAKGFGDETPSLQIDLEAFFRGFGDLDVLRLRRTPTGLFKGSILATYKSQSSADKFLSEPQEWNGDLLEAKTKTTWIQEKKDQDQKMSWDERRERDNQKDRNVRRFSAFKEMDMSKRKEKKRDEKKRDGRDGRRGRRDDKPRDRSASPVRVEEGESERTEEKAVESVTPAKRARSPDEEAPSLFSNKREKLDESAGEE